jgi:hypothetical protein
MKRILRTLIVLCVFGSGIVAAGFLYDVVSVSGLVLHLLLLGGTIILSCVGIRLCGMVEMLEGLVYRLAFKVARMSSK